VCILRDGVFLSPLFLLRRFSLPPFRHLSLTFRDRKGKKNLVRNGGRPSFPPPLLPFFLVRTSPFPLLLPQFLRVEERKEKPSQEERRAPPQSPLFFFLLPLPFGAFFFFPPFVVPFTDVLRSSHRSMREDKRDEVNTLFQIHRHSLSFFSFFRLFPLPLPSPFPNFARQALSTRLVEMRHKKMCTDPRRTFPPPPLPFSSRRCHLPFLPLSSSFCPLTHFISGGATEPSRKEKGSRSRRAGLMSYGSLPPFPLFPPPWTFFFSPPFSPPLTLVVERNQADVSKDPREEQRASPPFPSSSSSFPPL